MDPIVFQFVIIGLGIGIILIILYNSIFVVSGKSIKILERRWVGRSMPEGRVIAQKGEIGIQAKILGPGLYFRFPFLFTSRSESFITVGNLEIALIESIDGEPVPKGRIFGKMVDCNLFQDAELFLTNGGEKGPQIQFLPTGTYKINTSLFRINKVEVTVIPDGYIGLVEAIDGLSIEQGKIFANIVDCDNFQNAELFFKNGGEKGPQIKVLPPGNYRINTQLFIVRIVPAIVIEKGKIGVVTAMDGKPISGGRLLAKKTEEHSNFEDGAAFLASGGEKGPQTQILLPGTYRINMNLFRLEIYDATTIPSMKVGLVTAKDGLPLPENEYVASRIEGHDNYQNTEAFIKNNGQRGPQFDVLRPGMYYVNPLMFDVLPDDVAVVQRGEVAVLVSNVGKEPDASIKAISRKVIGLDPTEEINALENRLDKGIERYVVPKGFRGIQEEVSGPGMYYLNRRAYIPYIINTTNITVDWDEGDKTKFDPLAVVSHDGFMIKVSVKVVIRVRPDQAPFMVAKIGSIENLVEHVIHPMIDSSFRNQASTTSAMNFMQNRHEEQEKAEIRTRLELEKYHVELVSVLICQILLPDELMKTQTEKILSEQRVAMFQQMQIAENERKSMENTKAEADKQGILVQSKIDVAIAENLKLKRIKEAEGEKEYTRLTQEGIASGIESVGKAKGTAILAEGTSTAEAYKLQKQAIGETGVIAISVAEKLALGNVKVTPDFLVNGGNGTEGLLASFLVNKITEGKKEN